MSPKPALRIRALVGYLAVLVVAAIGGSAAVLAEDLTGPAASSQTLEAASAGTAMHAVAGDTGEARGNPDRWLPADFAEVMGYRPIVEDVAGVPAATRADGGCSSPVGDADEPIGAACRAHDFGYDLMRYADATGEPIPTAARHAVDAQFAADMERACHGGTRCDAVAGLYDAAVRVNSVREGWVAPVPVSATVPTTKAAIVAGGVAAAGMLIAAVLPWLRRRPGRLAGVAGLLVAVGLSWLPGLLPREPIVQAALTAVLALQGYVAGRLVGRVIRTIRGHRQVPALPQRIRPHALRSLGGVAGMSALMVIAGAGTGAQASVAAAAGAVEVGFGTQLIAAAAGLAAAALIVMLVLVAVRGVRALVARPRLTPSRPHRALGRAVAVMLLVPTLVLSTTAAGEPANAGATATAVADSQQRRFLDTTAHAQTIAKVTGHKALEPVRVYVPQRAAGTAEARAKVAVRELREEGGFDRSVLMMITPTGTGWVNPAAAQALEYVTGGDSATVAVQYDTLTSYMSFLTGGPRRAAEQADALYRAVLAEWHRLPVGERPQLLVYGESLGSLGALEAPSVQSAPASIRRLWVGVPGPVRSALGSPGETVVEHPDDPVSAWSFRLLLGPDGQDRSWLPVVSFWSATADLINSIWAPPGHGHRYSGELGPAMATVVRPGNQVPHRGQWMESVQQHLVTVYDTTS